MNPSSTVRPLARLLPSLAAFAVLGAASHTLASPQGVAPAAAGPRAPRVAPPPPPPLALLPGDDCSQPIPISGEGSFPFDLTGMTTGAEGQAECVPSLLDMWLRWTAPASGLARVSTCNSTSVFPVLAAYPAAPGCPLDGSSLACDDSSPFCVGSWGSLIDFPVTAGTDYLIQVGSQFPVPQAGVLDIVVLPPAGPEDDCQTPAAIAGQGSFPFNLVLATTGAEGQGEALCDQGGSTTAIEDDVWLRWTADADGMAILTACDSGLQHTKIALYPAAGGCPAPGSALACSWDGCSIQPKLLHPVLQGAQYLIQIGQEPGTLGVDPGLLEIAITDPPECYALDAGDAPFAFGIEGDFLYGNAFEAEGGADVIRELSATFGRTTTFDLGFPAGSPLVWAIWEDPTDDLDPSDAQLLWSAADTADATAIQTLVFQSIAVPDVLVRGTFFVGLMLPAVAPGASPAAFDHRIPTLGRSWYAGGAAGTGNLADLAANEQPPVTLGTPGSPITGVWLLRARGAGCDGLSPTGTLYCTAAPGGGCPCGNAGSAASGCANSTGLGARLLAAGSASLSAADLVLVGAQLPPNQPGLFYQGANALGGGAGVPFGDGLRCAGGSVVRLEVRTADAGGAALSTVDVGQNGGASAGTTLRYQLWYRDPTLGPCGAGFNLSNGLEIVWLP